MDFSTALSNLSGAAELVKLLVNERDRQKLASIQIDLTEKITHTQIQLAEVLSSIVEKDRFIQSLTERVRKLEGEEREKERYRLTEVGSVGQFLAYALRPAAEVVERSDEPAHFICQPCFDIRQQKSILRFIGSYCTCPSCGRKEQVTLVEARPQRSMYATGFEQ